MISPSSGRLETNDIQELKYINKELMEKISSMLNILINYDQNNIMDRTLGMPTGWLSTCEK
jgi:hypothetical protein